MMMTPAVRKFALTAHVLSSVGWLGAVAAFFALTITALTTTTTAMMQASYLAMNIIGESVLVPLSLAALASGVIQSLGTPWGLFRHYWVAVKFVLTVVAAALLVLHQFMAVSVVAQRVLDAGAVVPDVGGLGVKLARDAAGGLLLLLAATVLLVYKPWGRIRREQVLASRGASLGTGRLAGLRGGNVLLIVVAILLTLIVVLHLTGNGFRPH
jgi:hypothetical protein